MKRTNGQNYCPSKLSKCYSEQLLKKNYKFQQNPIQIGTRPKFQTTKPKWAQQQYHTQRSNENKSIRPSLSRIKSVDSLNKMRESIIFENIVQVYRKQNNNLKQQNKYLLKQIAKRQKNQEILSNYIEQLRKQIKSLQKNKYGNIEMQAKTPRSNIKLLYSNVCMDQGDTWNTANQIQDLHDQFNGLMEQCSKQKNKKNREAIRYKLASTAQKMRNIKKLQ